MTAGAVNEGNPGHDLTPKELREMLLREYVHPLDPSDPNEIPIGAPNKVLYSLLRTGFVQWVNESKPIRALCTTGSDC